MLRQHGFEQGRDDLLLGLGKPRDRVELLFEARGWPAPSATLSGGRCGVMPIAIADQHLDRSGEQLCEPGEHGHGHAATPDLVGGELGLGDAQGVGKLDLGEIGAAAGVGDARAERLK